MKIGAGALHRYTKNFGELRQKLAAVFGKDGRKLVAPLDVVEAKAEYWGALWQASSEPLPPEDWWPELRKRAQLQEPRQVDLEDLGQALRCFRSKVGQGGDKTNPR